MSVEPAEYSVRALDLAIERLATVDLEPLTSRALYQAAERRLRGRHPRLSPLERVEPAILVAMASLHLLWAIGRVLSAF